MGNRGLNLAVGMLLSVAIGVGVAYGYKEVRGKPVATNQPATASSPSPSPSPEASPSPSEAPSPSPPATPSPVPSPTAAGPATYPATITAGSSYNYSGSGLLIVGAQDGTDAVSSVCAGINDSTQAFPPGYGGVFFVAIQFADGNRISAGFVRNAAGRTDFGTIQNNGTGFKDGAPKAGPTSGSHTYCVTHSGSSWAMTDDGATIFSTTLEGAGASNGQLLFASSAQKQDPSQAQASFSLVVPGFHDISAGGAAPTQLRSYQIG